jgi:hypothetical protein
MIIHIKRIDSIKLYVSRSEGSVNPDQNTLFENPDVNALLEDQTIILKNKIYALHNIILIIII